MIKNLKYMLQSLEDCRIAYKIMLIKALKNSKQMKITEYFKSISQGLNSV